MNELVLKNITKSYSGIRVLDNVSVKGIVYFGA
jgi:ABC-type sugar transport system ATPase subunit